MGSLLGQTCRSVSALGRCDAHTNAVAETYGRHAGIVFQLGDEIQCFTRDIPVVGLSPGLIDLASVPVIVALSEPRSEAADLVAAIKKDPEDVSVHARVRGGCGGPRGRLAARLTHACRSATLFWIQMS